MHHHLIMMWLMCVRKAQDTVKVAKFYIQDSDMNDPEFAEIIEQEAEKVEKESKFKKQYHRGLKLYVKGDSVYYGVQGVMNLVEKHNKLVDILNKKGVIND